MAEDTGFRDETEDELAQISLRGLMAGLPKVLLQRLSDPGLDEFQDKIFAGPIGQWLDEEQSTRDVYAFFKVALCVLASAQASYVYERHPVARGLASMLVDLRKAER